MILTILILQFNKSYLTKGLLQSIHQFDFPNNYKIIVIDNASTEDNGFALMKEEFPLVEFKVNDTNLGFAKAINKEARSWNNPTEYLLLLNNDTLLQEDSIHQSLAAIQQVKGDVLTCQLSHENGNRIHNYSTPPHISSFLLLNLPGLSVLWRKYISESKKIRQVYYINGAFLMIRFDLFKLVGFFCEDFFMYAEDLDLMYKLSNAKAKMFYYPQTTIIHADGKSTAAVWNDQDKANMIISNEMVVLNRFNAAWLVKVYVYTKYFQQYLKWKLNKHYVASLYVKALSKYL